MKITVEDIKQVRPGKPLIKILENRLACNTLRNLVSYVNLTYPVDGYRYTVHVTRENVVSISLIEKD